MNAPILARTSTPLRAGGVWPPARPQLLREYAHAREFHRHAAQLARTGWYPVSVRTSDLPVLLRAIDALSLGLLSLFTRAAPAILVTYSTR